MCPSKLEELYEETTDFRIYEIVAPPQFSSERVDKFVTERIADITRSKVQKLIDMQLIELNRSHVQRASQKVTAGDVLSVRIPMLRRLRAEPENIPLQIVYEDDDMLAVNKAPGMVVHPAVGNRTGTLVNALANYCTSLSTVNGAYRPGIVHRLDKFTSGIIIAAKNDRVHNTLARKFENRDLNKTYLALVWGELSSRTGEIRSNIGRHKGDRKKFAVQNDGKFAETHFEVLESFRFMSFVKIRILTGRTHQIRVHFSEMGHPVVGDTEYGGRTKKLKSLAPHYRRTAIDVLDIINRQALHSHQLEMSHPVSGEPLCITAELPEDMQRALMILRETEL